MLWVCNICFLASIKLVIITSCGSSLPNFRATNGVSIARSAFCTAGFSGVANSPSTQTKDLHLNLHEK